MRSLYIFILLPTARFVVWLLSLVKPKLNSSLTEQQKLKQFLQQLPINDAPLIWVHAVSAGEFLQSEPILRRAARDGFKLFITGRSISALHWHERIKDWPSLVYAGLLCIENSRLVKLALDKLRPQAIIYMQNDLLPQLVYAAQKRGITQIMLAARASSRGEYRGNWPLRGFFTDLYRRIDLIMARGMNDYALIKNWLGEHEGLIVGGDPGFESIIMRKSDAQRHKSWQNCRVIILGSLQPSDLEIVLPVMRDLLHEQASLKLIAVPHEPDSDIINAIESQLNHSNNHPINHSRNYPNQRWSVLEEDKLPTTRVIILDQMGKLMQLYAWSDIAYVGGGFGRGVHNVAEPLIYGMPVLFGPQHINSSIAGEMLSQGYAQIVKDSSELKQHCEKLLEDKPEFTSSEFVNRAIATTNSIYQQIIKELKKNSADSQRY